MPLSNAATPSGVAYASTSGPINATPIIAPIAANEVAVSARVEPPRQQTRHLLLEAFAQRREIDVLIRRLRVARVRGAFEVVERDIRRCIAKAQAGDYRDDDQRDDKRTSTALLAY